MVCPMLPFVQLGNPGAFPFAGRRPPHGTRLRATGSGSGAPGVPFGPCGHTLAPPPPNATCVRDGAATPQTPRRARRLPRQPAGPKPARVRLPHHDPGRNAEPQEAQGPQRSSCRRSLGPTVPPMMRTRSSSVVWEPILSKSWGHGISSRGCRRPSRLPPGSCPGGSLVMQCAGRWSIWHGGREHGNEKRGWAIPCGRRDDGSGPGVSLPPRADPPHAWYAREPARGRIPR
jgi:hypothetical protein